MRFDEAKQKAKDIEKRDLKSQKKKYQSVSNIASVTLYENVAVYLMKPGTKGNFKYISTLANNGKEAISWAIRVYYTTGKWSAQVAPHPGIDKSDINVSISEILDKYEKRSDVESFANLHIGTVRSEKEKVVENAINYLISELRDKKLKGVENFILNEHYTLQSSTQPYKIVYNLNKIQNRGSEKKYRIIQKFLVDKQIRKSEREKLNSIQESLTTEDKEFLYGMSKKYLSESERIRIAMIYMSS